MARTVTVGGRTIAYDRLGTSGPPVVFLHGLAGDRLSWVLVSPRVAALARTFALDLPGHGGSDKDVGPGDVGFFVGIVREVLDALDLSDVHLVGHSLGGAIAIATASAIPDRIASLTLLAPAGLGPVGDMDLIRDLVALDRVEDVPGVMSRILADPSLINRQAAEIIVAYKRSPGVRDALETICRAHFAADGTPHRLLTDEVAMLTMSIRAIWGQGDRIIPPATAAALPGHAQVRLIPAIGHAPNLEAPDVVVAAIREAIGTG